MIKRRDLVILVVLLLAGFLVLLFVLMPRWRQESKKEAQRLPLIEACSPKIVISNRQTTSVNKELVPIAANGSPLPAPANEDFVIQINLPDTILAYDADNQGWGLIESGYSICQVGGRYFVYNPAERVWDEIAYQDLSPQLQTLGNVNNYLLDQSLLNVFNQSAFSLDDQICDEVSNHQCAVWLASNILDFEYIQIRVNKKTKKITDVTLSSLKDGPQLISYYYQPVVVQKPGKIRYLRPP